MQMAVAWYERRGFMYVEVTRRTKMVLTHVSIAKEERELFEGKVKGRKFALKVQGRKKRRRTSEVNVSLLSLSF